MVLENKSRKTGITIEIALSIALSVIVLILALGLFSENLKEMISKLGVTNNFFSTTDKTTFSAENNTPTATQINVQIAAEQGLSSEHKQAKADIDDYYNNKSTNGVLNNPSDATGLAKALTTMALSAKSTNYEANLKELIPGTSTKYKDFGNSNGISFYNNKTYYGNEEVPWYTGNTSQDLTNANGRLSNIQAVQKEFK